jgi:putative transcriptional regulator
MGKFGKELIESMTQAATHARGRKVPGIRITTVKILDMKAIRRGKPVRRSEARQD